MKCKGIFKVLYNSSSGENECFSKFHDNLLNSCGDVSHKTNGGGGVSRIHCVGTVNVHKIFCVYSGC